MADLIVGDLTPRAQYTATSGQTDFTYAFPIFTDADLKVYVGTTLKTLTTDYTVSGAGTDNGGTVTLVTGATTGDTVTVYRDIPISRTSDYQTNGDLLASTLNDDLDKLTMMSQQNEDQVNNNTLKVDQWDEFGDLTLPNKATRAGTVLGFNSITGDPEAGPTIADTQSIANVTADIATLADIEDGTVATNAIANTSSISSDISTVSGISANVTTVAGNETNINAVAGISADVTTVATNNANVTTVAGINSDVTTTAGISAAVTAVAGNNTNISTVAGISANVTTVASISSDVTAVVADQADIGTVATDIANINAAVSNASDITAVAGNETNITTVAGNTTNINTVATNDTNVTTVAGIDADVTTVANNDSNVTAVAGNASNINAVVGNETNINAAVSNASNINSAVSNATNITAVAGNETNINAVNTNATNINTVATNNTNITTVATDITNVNLAATNIADITEVADEVAKVIEVANDLQETTSEIDTVATNITNVNNVGNDITNVNTVATNLTSINAFGEQYKVAATAPSGPSEGDLWFDTTADTMKVYSGTSWQNAGSSVNGVENSVEHTATASQTTFTATYDPGYLTVSLNGVQLSEDDYTATNGTSVVLDTGAALNDIVFIQSFGTFTLADHYDKTASDARYLATAGGTLTGNLSLGDNVKATFGASDDLEIYHDGNKSIIQDVGTGELQLRGTDLKLQDADGNNYIAMLDNGTGGTVKLKHNGNDKLVTTSTGIDVTGDIDLADNGKIKLGASDDLQIYHDGSNSYINDTGVGDLILQSQGNAIKMWSETGLLFATFYKAGSVNLYYDYANNTTPKLATTSTGIDVTGSVTSNDVNITDTTPNLQFKDTDGNHLANITQSGTHLYIDNDSTGDIRFRVDGNSEKLTVTSTGIDVTGSVTATSFSGDGSSLTGIEGVPSGIISMWSGAAAAIPSGWNLCDGNNGTPNLVGKFIKGGSTAGTTGGSGTTSSDGSHTHSTPSHSHSHSLSAGSHTLSTSEMPSHSHAGRRHTSSWSSSGTTAAQGNTVGAGDTGLNTGSTGGSSSHSHSLSGSITSGGSGTSGSNGSHTHTIEPVHYTLCYIMKA